MSISYKQNVKLKVVYLIGTNSSLFLCVCLFIYLPSVFEGSSLLQNKILSVIKYQMFFRKDYNPLLN